MRRRYGQWLVPLGLNLQYYVTQGWFSILDFTRPVRHRLGIRRGSVQLLQ